MKQSNLIGRRGPAAALIEANCIRARKTGLSCSTVLLALTMMANAVQGTELMVSDNFNVKDSGTGFGLNNGVNSGINPPKTRLAGSAAKGLRYILLDSGRPDQAFDIERQRLRVRNSSKASRFCLSENGRTAFDFGPSLRTDYASKINKAVYDVRISMRNDATSAARQSFGITTVPGDMHRMDFALQIYRAKPKDTFYTIQKRFDRGSYDGATTANNEGDLNEVMKTTAQDSAGTMVDFLIRVTDAGAEGSFTYNSRIQVSINDGASWIYDTESDANLPHGFRFDGTSRFFVFDQAPNGSGNVFYDDFSVTLVSTPKE